MKKFVLFFSSILVATLLTSCSGSEYETQVYIKTVLDGKPLAGATVTMSLNADEEYKNGPGSLYYRIIEMYEQGKITGEEFDRVEECSGKTDADGIYICRINNKILGDLYTIKFYDITGSDIYINYINRIEYAPKTKEKVDVTQTTEVELVYERK